MTITSTKLRRWLTSALLLSWQVFAQQTPEPLSLEQLLQQPSTGSAADIEVSTASRLQQSAAQSAQVTYLITADEISRLNLRTLGEVLSLLPGLYVSSDSSLGYVTARGIGRPGDYNSRLLFLVDGTRVNDNIYDAGLVGSNFYLDTQLIERVEFIPGTGSALYGNNAYLGVVNIISKKVHQLQDAQIYGSVSNQQQDWLLSYGLRNDDGHEGYVALSRNQRLHIPIVNSNSSVALQQARAQNSDHNNKLAGSYSYRRFALTFAGVQRDRLEPFELTRGISEGSVQSDNAFVAARYAEQLTNTLEWFGHLSTNRMLYKTITPADQVPAAPGQPANSLVFVAQGKWTNLDQRLRYQASASQLWLFGVDVQRDHHQSYRYALNDVAVISAAASDNLRIGWFGQHEWRLAPHHTLVTGLRYDHTQEQLQQWSPKLGWVWQWTTADQLRLNFGRAFRAPNEYELETNRFYQQAMPASEQITTTELSWQRQWLSGWQSNVSVYKNDIRNLITSAFGNSTLVPFFNESPVSAKGLELSVQRYFADQTDVSLSLSVQQATDQAGADLSNAPQQMLKMSFDKPLWRDEVFVSYRLFAASKRRTPLTELGGFANHDLALRWQLDLHRQVLFSVKNITDKRHLDAPQPSAVPLWQPSRSVELSVHWGFHE